MTPNLDEVRLLVGLDVRDRAGQYEAARLLHALGPRHVLVKGGHLRGDTEICVDLHYDGRTLPELPGPRFTTGNTHGGGDSMASAVASFLARGLPVDVSIGIAKALRRGGRPASLLPGCRTRAGVAPVGGPSLVARPRLRVGDWVVCQNLQSERGAQIS